MTIKRMAAFISFLASFALASDGYSQIEPGSIYRRSVAFDWDPTEDSRSYDLEIKALKQDQSGGTFTFNLKKASWSGKLVPGKYSFRVRSRDYRNVPGDWSHETPFTVDLENVKLKSPLPQSVLQALSGSKMLVKFEWSVVNGASKYKFVLSNADGETLAERVLTAPELELEVQASPKLTWKVSAESNTEAGSEKVAASQFSVVGAKLSAPEIVKPDNAFVRNLSWSRPEEAETFDLNLSQFRTDTKKWVSFKLIKDYQDTSLAFGEIWPGGQWKISLKAKAKNRPSSDVTSLTFKVAKGDRSPAAEYASTVRKSIDRINGWYGAASYLITMMSYESLARFNNAIGGTGRLGLGWLGSNSPWGFLSTLDMSGFIATSKNYTFASMEFSAIHRRRLQDTDELRTIGGIYLKELPVLLTPAELVQKSVDTNFEATPAKVTAMGPVAGLEYWHSLSPKLGLQLNTYLYYSLMKIGLPNGGQSLTPQLSSQLGLMGSYRVSNKFTGLTGITYRADKLSYTDDYGSRVGNASIPSQVDVTVSGLYLHFFAEVSF